MSDNGYSWGSHKWKPKQCPYEECIRVPMIMRYPPLGTTPRSDDRFVLNIDLAPTFVELAGASVPPTHVINGASVVPLLAGGGAGWRNAMLNEHWNGTIPTNALVKQGRCSVTVAQACKTTANCPSGESCRLWKYVEYVTGETELYNLTADPFELNNVTGKPAHTALKTKLLTKLRTRTSRSGGPVSRIPNAREGRHKGRRPAPARRPSPRERGLPTCIRPARGWTLTSPCRPSCGSWCA
jgi:arylsulfatase A-like enzyme